MDKDFLRELDNFNSHTIYARITSLSMQELPLERIEGKVTGGSINVDGTSAIRRTCSINMVASDININNFYCGLHTKFKLEIGLQNEINSDFPDIIWFQQGIYIVTSFNTSYTTSGFTISITGKDKMCLLNGEVGGSLPASIDFGVSEYVDLENMVTTYTDVPIATIIRESVHAYALEPYSNIVINDLDKSGLELLEYRCEKPAYMLKQADTNEYTQFTTQGDKQCWIAATGQKVTLETIPNYDQRIDNLTLSPGDEIYTDLNNKIKFTVAKIEYGQTVGYRLTDLVYSGELISSIGEAFTSILNKIVTMLGNFEYFYDLDGRFIFQAKKTYINTSWNSIVTEEGDRYAENAIYTSQVSYNFEGNNLISSFSNTPNITNIKNDYSIWGKRTTTSGAEVPIHYRYAIHNKPTNYYSIKYGKDFTVEEYDWRELIYRMAEDYYLYNENGVLNADGSYTPLYLKIQQNNPQKYPTGLTGYEQFYIDIQGFWRELYDPEYAKSPSYCLQSYSRIDGKATFKPDEEELYIQQKYTRWDEVEDLQRNEVVVVKQIDGNYELQNLMDTIPIDYENNTYYITSAEGYRVVTEEISKYVQKKEFYVKVDDEYISVLDFVDLDENCFVCEDIDGYILVSKLPSQVQPIYKSGDGAYNKYYLKHTLGLNGKPEEDVELETCYLDYYIRYYDYYEVGDELQYWNKNIIEAPDLLNFWIDFLDSEEDGELSKFAISVIGDRPKVVNNDKVSSIYFRDVPNVIFKEADEEIDLTDRFEKTGYFFMNLEKGASEYNYFTISAQGKSAKDELDEQLYNHSYCTESVNISAIPVYYLEPNTRIYIRDDKSQINGEYIISRISIPLTYNGTMSITASKAPQRIY